MRSLLAVPILLLLPEPVSAQTVYVRPYVQPGDGSGLTGSDVKVLGWVTDQTPGEFVVEYHASGQPANRAALERVSLNFGKARPKRGTPTPRPAARPEGATSDASSPTIPKGEQRFFKYSAALPALPFDDEVTYRVTLGEQLVRQGTVKTRASATKSFRCVLVGDLANGKPEQKAVAWQISLQRPDFLVALGDIVYSGGRVSEYMRHFWSTYNDVSQAGPKTGAPLMASVPFYPVLGNHDADARELSYYPDAFGAFYFFSVPLNGPGIGPWNLSLGRNAKRAAAFRQTVGAQYPALSVYSFDYGPGHFVVLDSNSYTTNALEKLIPWLEKDLTATTQRWKIVCFHVPAFHTSKEHFTEQKMRLLEPVFEEAGVDFVFSGHVHNYQRSKPLRFTPNPPRRDFRGRVDGEFLLDESFDGVKATTPQGVIHIVSGGGGAELYSADFEKTVEWLKKKHPRNWVSFTAKYYGDKHSFSVVELSSSELILRQINIDGQEIDRINITKPE